MNGGNVWESNPPRMVLAPSTGFEVREGHQSPCAPAGVFIANQTSGNIPVVVKYQDFRNESAFSVLLLPPAYETWFNDPAEFRVTGQYSCSETLIAGMITHERTCENEISFFLTIKFQKDQIPFS